MSERLAWVQNMPLQIVHVRSLGEFEYCSRAGIISVENQTQEGVDEDDSRIPDLSYTPLFEFQRLREEVAASGSRLAQSLFLLFIVTIALLLVSRSAGLNHMYPMWLSMILPGLMVQSAWRTWLPLFSEYVAYRNATEGPLLHQQAAMAVEVDWRSLSKVYQVRFTQESYFDPELALAGRPWAILTWHNYRIPVIRSRHRQVAPGAKMTHLRKLAAYCYLLRSQERCQSDWGVVIYDDSRTGFAYPIDDVATNNMLRKLSALRKAFTDHLQGTRPAKGEPEACVHCPLNRRRTYSKGRSETLVAGRPILPFVAKDKTHCDCGDRFEWTPPTAS